MNDCSASSTFNAMAVTESDSKAVNSSLPLLDNRVKAKALHIPSVCAGADPE